MKSEIDTDLIGDAQKDTEDRQEPQCSFCAFESGYITAEELTDMWGLPDLSVIGNLVCSFCDRTIQFKKE